MQGRFPFRFFVITFAWAWLTWLPLVLGYRGIGPVGKDTVVALTMPLTLLVAAFGPALGAIYCIKTYDGWAAVRRCLRGLFDLRLGWRAYLGAIVMLGGCTAVAWILPETWGEPRLGAFLDALPKLPLFFLPFSGQGNSPLVAFLILTVGWSWIFAWIREASERRIASGPHAHGLANAMTFVFPTLIPTSGIQQTRYWIRVTLIFATGLLVTLSRKRRRVPVPASVDARHVTRYSLQRD